MKLISELLADLLIFNHSAQVPGQIEEVQGLSGVEGVKLQRRSFLWWACFKKVPHSKSVYFCFIIDGRMANACQRAGYSFRYMNAYAGGINSCVLEFDHEDQEIDQEVCLIVSLAIDV